METPARDGRGPAKPGAVVRISVRRGRRAAIVLSALVAAVVPGLASPAQAAAPKTAVIVQLEPGFSAAVEARLAAAGGNGQIAHVYRSVLNGFAGEFTDAAIAALRRNPHVLSVEPDGVATVADITAGSESPTPSWGLDRIDQHNRPLSNSYTYSTTASNVTAYVIDTGIDPAAADLAGRIGTGVDEIGDGHGTVDCNGHGTHVSGTIGGVDYGVAKGVTLVPVRVLDCTGSGSWSGVIAGLDWVVGNHASGVPAVANMSLGGGRNSSVDAAVQRAISAGVTVAVAAGNNGTNACNYSPSRVSAAVTVGATDINDRRASWSNYGACLDLFAPGVNIKSDWMGGLTNTISGTSMATPHVTGAAAILLAKTPTLSPAQVASLLLTNSTKSVVSSAGSRSPNRLLFSS
jgi:subtilisin family serine protease